ncbi:hypothetical protein CNMCM5623_008847 [Aspergillus felis]|uniref:MORN repeat protein n=1 Tax=Aspergillus felis TaxID=1287682 RepID=A0A8H6URI1_9EURO|nr:hypothetical protein CNMCM5623_008847 [Aspergillus felis]KAF7180777.1 hypothetical protein CNMCM7691_010068 [Aspergillus felis]
MPFSSWAGYLDTPMGKGNYEGTVLLPAPTAGVPTPVPTGTSPLGQGTMWFNDGSSYIGAWSKGSFHGTGFFRTRTFDYNGEFANGKITGKGTKSYKQLGEYKGWFINGKREGQGKMTWADGGTYDGQWINDKMDGAGKMTWPNGDWWQSTWRGTISETKAGKGQHGPGRAHWHNKPRHPEVLYVGDTKDGLRHGLGTLTKPEHKYEGNFTNGELHGKIKVTNLNTKKITYRRYHHGDLDD